MVPRIALVVVLAVVAGVAAADQEQVLADLTDKGDQVLHVLQVQEVVEHSLPMVRVRAGKIRISAGLVADELALETDDLRVVQWLISGKYLFRLLLNDGTVGVLRYSVVPRGKTPGKGIWLEALPVDTDPAFRELVAGGTASLDQRVATQIAREIETLRSDHAFLLATTGQ